jgi:hypothetical protein
VRYRGLDHHFDAWLTENTLRQRYDDVRSMIQDFGNTECDG